LSLAVAATTRAEESPKPKPKTRTFLFTYSAKVTGLAPGEAARIWVPVPGEDTDQAVKVERKELPAEPQVGQEPKYGNRMLYLEAKAGADGAIPLSLTYRVRRCEVCEDDASPAADKSAAGAKRAEQFLQPDAKVPVGGKPATLIADTRLADDQVRRARELYDLVNARMQYRKDQPGWGRGDAEWACDSRFGNCTDFHSLFISLARTTKLPAKFEIGFPVPEKRGAGAIPGYHCWAKFKPDGRGWIPVDVSEANKHPEKADYFFGHLCENRVAFSVGRDLDLVPKQAGAPLNFFVYPYAEVAGKPYPPEKIEKKFAYQDVEQEGVEHAK
jgi:transglutaminase-like putative cysteine protease